jgi:outer membrane protein assembly factor BamB
MHVEGPTGAWTVRLASLIYDEPAAELWDAPGLLLVKYGFRVYALGARSGELVWSRQSGTPVVAVLCSTRLDTALVQTEIETLSLRADGEVAWRAAHNEVVTAAELVGGRLVLTSYGGQLLALDPRTGRSLD